MDGLFNLTDLNDYRKKFRRESEQTPVKESHKNLFGSVSDFERKSVKSDFKPRYRKPAVVIRDMPQFVEHIKIILLDEGLDRNAREFTDRAYKIQDSRKLLTLAEEYVQNPVCPDVKLDSSSGLFRDKQETENASDPAYWQVRPGYVFQILSDDGVMVERIWLQHPEQKGRKDRIQKNRLNWSFLKKINPSEAETETASVSRKKNSVQKVSKTDNKLADKLRSKADSLTETVKKKLNPAIGNQNYTRRRASIAKGIIEEGMKFELAQKILYAASEAVQNGKKLSKTFLKYFDSRPMMQNFAFYYQIETGEHDNKPYDVQYLKEQKRKIKGLAEALETAKELMQGQSGSERRAEMNRQEKLNTLRDAKIPGFFPTPLNVLEKLLDRMEEITGRRISSNSRILEPSAGKGDIAEVLRALTGNLDVCEINYTLREILKEEGFNVVGEDFLEYNPGQVYDFIIMNPPFENRQDSAHIIHAYSMLRPEGVIASIASATFSSSKSWNMFAMVEDGKEIEITPLEKDSFKGKDSFIQTGVNAVMVIIQKPAMLIKSSDNDEISSDEMFSGIDLNDSDFVDDDGEESFFDETAYNKAMDEFRSNESEQSAMIFNLSNRINKGQFNEKLMDTAKKTHDDMREIYDRKLLEHKKSRQEREAGNSSYSDSADAKVENWKSDIPYDTAKFAHYGTSFTPERRAEQEKESYAAMLSTVYEIRKRARALGREAEFDADFERFRNKFRELYIASLQAKSKVLSPMISGPANFPTRRNQKANNIADSRMRDLIEYREKALKRFKLEYRPETEKPINAGAENSLQRLQEKLESLEKNRSMMKEANKIVRSKKDVIPRLMQLGFSQKQAEEIIKPDFMGRIGFADYNFSNMSQEISRVKARIAEEERIQEKKEQPADEFSFDGGFVRAEIDDNRWRIHFDSKPNKDTITALKKAGWKWSPSNKAWQRQYNTLDNSMLIWNLSKAGIELEKKNSNQSGLQNESVLEDSDFETVRNSPETELQAQDADENDDFEKDFISELESENISYNYTGSKYESTRGKDIAEIAKFIRNEIRDLIKKKVLPSHPKYSVTIERYSMGQSITVRVKDLLPLKVLNEKRVYADLEWKSGAERHSDEQNILNPEGKRIQNILENICRQYNESESDSQTDYSRSRFHITVSLEYWPEREMLEKQYKERESDAGRKLALMSNHDFEAEDLDIMDFSEPQLLIPDFRDSERSLVQARQPSRILQNQNLFNVNSVDDLFDGQTIELNQFQDQSWRMKGHKDFQLKSENMQRLPFQGTSKRVRAERMNEEKKKNEKSKKKKHSMTIDDLTPEQRQKLIEITKKKSEEAFSGKTRVNI